MNNHYTIDKTSLVVSAIILFLTLSVCGIGIVYVLNDPAVKYSQVMVKAAVSIRDSYQDHIDWDEAIDSSRSAMINELDRFSGYVDHEALVQFREDLTGGYFGIGILIVQHDLGLMILSVREGSPASEAGLLNGDIIIKADSTSLAGISSFEAINHLKGKENTELKAEIFRPATNDTLDVKIIRQRIDFEHIPFAGYTSDSMIYIRLLDFNAGAATDMKKALDSLVEKSEVNLQGIIIDLRNNPGGLLSEARKIVGLFLAKGEFIVGTSGRSRWNRENYYVENSGGFENLPLAILVNKGTASASEILAGALRYSNHAALIGDTTFGKGLVQGFISLPDGDGLRLTISRYFFDGDRYINAIDSLTGKVSDSGAGLIPDIQYSFVEREDFILAIERSLLLIEFAHKNQDGLVDAKSDDNTRQLWLSTFQKYAYENGFDYESETKLLARFVVEDSESKQTKRFAEKVLSIAAESDKRLFAKHAGYIWMRLRQIAYERKYGEYQAYRDVVVPESELIQLAAEVLKEKSNR